jgi:predicted kinase
MEVVMLIGIQGSGKSTFARRFIDSHVRLNLDMLRTRHREGLLFAACLQAKAPVLIDNTNVTREQRRRFLEPALAAGFSVRGFYFVPLLEECIGRNARRSKPVPEGALHGTLRRLEPPTRAEGFAELHAVRIVGADFAVEEYADHW